MTKGKLNIAIMDEITISGNYVTARINISEGDNYYIQNLHITGLEHLKEKYINRELLFSTGD